MKRFLITTTALSMIVTSGPLPVYAQQSVRVGDREVICLRNNDEPCPDGASCVVAKRAANCERNANRKFGDGAEALVPAQAEVTEEAPEGEEPVLIPDAGEAASEIVEEAPAEAEIVEELPVEETVTDAPAEEFVPEVEAEVEAEPILTEEAPAAEAEVAVEPEPEPEPAPEVAAEEAPIEEVPFEEVPVEEEPAFVEEAPVEEAPALAEEAPLEEAPALAEDAPADEAPLAADEAVSDEPLLTEDAPATLEDAPAVAEDAPVAAEDAPLVAEDEAVATDDAPAVTEAPVDAAPEAVTDAPADPASEVPTETVSDAPLTEEQLLDAVDPAEGVEAPTAEAVGALSDILADDDAAEAPVAAAAAEPLAVEEDPTDTGTSNEAASDDAVAEDLTDEPAGRASPRQEVVEVTEEDTRSSDEDFEGEVIATERARDEGGRDRLSNLEKFGLVALGALVVGSVLRNGNQVVSNTGDRVVVQQPDGTYVVLKDDDALIRQPGSTVRTETFSDGSTRSIVVNADGSRVVTIRDAAGRVLKRSRIDAAGREVLLIDDLTPVERIDVTTLPAPRQGAVISTSNQDAELRAALLAEDARSIGRTFSLRQIRDYREVRALAPSIDVESITFPSGSAAIRATEAQKLAQLGRLMASMVEENPAELFLIEGHTDAVGAASYNLALSDRRAESVALALTEYYGVPPENMVVQGYGEQELLVQSASDEPANRRAAVKIISPLLQRVAAN